MSSCFFKNYFLFSTMIFTALLSISAYSAPNREITVGTLEGSDNYSSLMTHVYKSKLGEIVKSDDHTIKYIDFDTIEKLLSAVEKEQVDLGLGFSKHSGRESYFNFTLPLVASKTAAWSPAVDISSNASVYNYRWACVKQSFFCYELKQLGVIDIVEVDRFSELFSTVTEGKADILLSSYLSIAQFIQETGFEGNILFPAWANNEQIRLISSKNKTEANSLINKAILEYQTDGYKSEYTKHNNAFNEYIQVENSLLSLKNTYSDTDSFEYSISDNAFPFSFISEEGEHMGYIPDLFNLIHSKTGIHFSNSIPSKSLELSSIDILPLTIAIKDIPDSYIETNPYMDIKYRAIVINKVMDIDKNDVSGVLFAGLSFNQNVKNKVFGESTIVYNDIERVLKSLKYGIIDKAYIREDILSEIISSSLFSDYKVLLNEDRIYQAKMLVKDQILADFLNATFATLDKEDINTIRNKHFSFNINYGVDKKNFLIVSVTLGLIIVSLILIYFTATKKLTIKVETKKKRLDIIEKNRLFLQSVIKSIPAKIWIHTSKKELLLTNCPMHLSKQCSKCVLSDSNNGINWIENWEEIYNVLTSGQSAHGTVKSGCSFIAPRQYSYSRLRIAIGSNKYGVLTIASDITDEKRNQQLLIEANKKAQLAVEARQMFLATMSHELRTPIAGMIGLLELIGNRNKDKEIQFLLTQIESSAHSLNTLVNDILDFSKLESNQVVISPEETVILPALCECFRRHYVVAKKKGLKLIINWPASRIGSVTTDFFRVEQIVNNLLSNAIKFTHHGSITIDVDIEPKELVINISDTGVGMTEEQKKSVFSPFVQADGSITRKYGGTGLGLSIVQELTSLMGGSVDLLSATGSGTAVSVKLPVTSAQYSKPQFEHLEIEAVGLDPAVNDWLSKWTESNIKHSRYNEQPSKTHVVISQDTPQPNTDAYQICINTHQEDYRVISGNSISIMGHPFFPDLLFNALEDICDESPMLGSVDISQQFVGKVLVAEDNPINATLLQKQLNEFGLDVDIVENGLLAFNMLTQSEEEFDLLITDYHMPDLDGLQLTKALRELEFEMPIIVCTAEDSQHINTELNDVGLTQVLFKPYSLVDLKQLLSENLPLEGSPNPSNNNSSKPDQRYWLNQYAQPDAIAMCEVFIDTISSELEMLKQAVSDQNYRLLRNIAHRIKGGIGSLGLAELSVQAKSIEHTASEASQTAFVDCELFIAELKDELQAAQEWLAMHNT
ncbi:ATP-binding protein [Photobacterium rosenbergii]|uniref:histidine kinase n=1 Tax=Photobacterium rosenbergii TaxID=294936 RepID=A0ABU3ZJW5_9GAMM|nr:ATP-binding protein [Photobacterium rosenbergii]MDV5170392.1 ATP-binding protein [Photobacterium rosenbergii]